MKIYTVNECRIEVELASAEAEALGVSYDSLDWGDADTRRALWSLLGMVRARGAELCLSGRLLIEAGLLPDGLRLCFTSLPPRTGGSVASLVKEGVSVLRCAARGDLLAAAACLPQVSLTAYTRGETWFLLAEGACDPLALSRAAEFGEPVKPGGAYIRPVLEEYCSRVPLG